MSKVYYEKPSAASYLAAMRGNAPSHVYSAPNAVSGLDLFQGAKPLQRGIWDTSRSRLSEGLAVPLRYVSQPLRAVAKGVYKSAASTLGHGLNAARWAIDKTSPGRGSINGDHILQNKDAWADSIFGRPDDNVVNKYLEQGGEYVSDAFGFGKLAGGVNTAAKSLEIIKHVPAFLKQSTKINTAGRKVASFLDKATKYNGARDTVLSASGAHTALSLVGEDASPLVKMGAELVGGMPGSLRHSYLSHKELESQFKAALRAKDLKKVAELYPQLKYLKPSKYHDAEANKLLETTAGRYHEMPKSSYAYLKDDGYGATRKYKGEAIRESLDKTMDNLFAYPEHGAGVSRGTPVKATFSVENRRHGLSSDLWAEVEDFARARASEPLPFAHDGAYIIPPTKPVALPRNEIPAELMAGIRRDNPRLYRDIIEQLKANAKTASRDADGTIPALSRENIHLLSDPKYNGSFVKELAEEVVTRGEADNLQALVKPYRLNRKGKQVLDYRRIGYYDPVQNKIMDYNNAAAAAKAVKDVVELKKSLLPYTQKESSPLEKVVGKVYDSDYTPIANLTGLAVKAATLGILPWWMSALISPNLASSHKKAFHRPIDRILAKYKHQLPALQPGQLLRHKTAQHLLENIYADEED